jgi:hypothetical protein
MIVEDWTGRCDTFDPPECDCPVAHLHLDYVCVDVHFEADGSVHVLADAGDWQMDTDLIGVADLEDAKTKAIAWFAGATREDEGEDLGAELIDGELDFIGDVGRVPIGPPSVND